MKPTLLILAAGIGSRYGSLKQLDQLGPSGETIIDYSVFDAIRAGFGKVVFVIRQSIEQEFKEHFAGKFSDKIEVDYVLQELDNVPEGIEVPADRVKPWGTGHAVLVAAEAIQEPFAMINADDFYGREAFETIGAWLAAREVEENTFCLLGYKLKNTLSDFGSVSRGVCEADEDGHLVSITERTKISRTESGIEFEDNGETQPLDEDTIVSMNIMGFTPKVFSYANEFFHEFIQAHSHELKSEFYIPTVMSRSINEKETDVELLTSEAKWFGVTYKEDKEAAVEALKELVAQGVYPAKLWDHSQEAV
ncbi:sugar phosphate nucleotidyltransferase [Pontibacter sp. G13]|uniref:nucleotidyltransferase family protein n=1 Tax=Pontibacter sp. G13 TaxID=3074898 RepID=UPI002889F62E|nr:sugar phosphate nucleotidyltransferase [Pontibacter sp. G13]WNJ17586.1 sugar phosphate nucleotidyltransferase [Pontibacter sp. G13]